MQMRGVLVLFTLAGAALAVACGDDGGTDPVIEQVAEAELPGNYTATTFTLDIGAGPIDLIGTGASIQLGLASGGVASGQIFVPGLGEGGGDFDESLEGTWSYVQPTLSLDHAADTFMRDLPLTASKVNGVIQLEGEKNFGDETIHVVLVKGP
jgi:hypothetical protein